MPKQRDIVLLPVPYSDLSANKRRPVLVLSSDASLRRSSDMLVAFITSNLGAAGAAGIIIDAADLEAGVLPRRSLIRADKIYTLRQSDIVKPYGVLNKAAFDKVLAELDIVLGR